MHRVVAVLMVLVLGTMNVLAQAVKDTEKAAATRKILEETKISVEYKDTLLQDVLRDLAERTMEASKKKVEFKVDPTGAASNNQKINYEAKDKTVKVVLDELTKKADLGWTIVSGKYKSLGTKYDGVVFITK